MNWLTLVHHINNNDLEEFVIRSPQVQAKYDRYKLELKKRRLSPGKVLRRSFFSDGQLVHLADNQFPYDLTPNIKHMVLWINPSLTITSSGIKSLLESLLDVPYIHTKNKPKYQSVPDLEHYHVFVLRNQ